MTSTLGCTFCFAVFLGNNYVRRVKLACRIAQVSTAAFDDRSLKRAKVSTAKGRTFVAKKQMFVCMPMLRDLNRVAEGTKPFARFTPATALDVLRGSLAKDDVTEAKFYRTHDLRRGHARDLQTSGSSLVEILSAGEWRSPAFLTYLDKAQLETDAVIDAHFAESSGGEGE